MAMGAGPGTSVTADQLRHPTPPLVLPGERLQALSLEPLGFSAPEPQIFGNCSNMGRKVASVGRGHRLCPKGLGPGQGASICLAVTALMMWHPVCYSCHFLEGTVPFPRNKCHSLRKAGAKHLPVTVSWVKEERGRLAGASAAPPQQLSAPSPATALQLSIVT